MQDPVSAAERERRCSICGYGSANHSFFRREPTGIFGRTADFCLACGPYAPTKRELAMSQGPPLFVIASVPLLAIGGLSAVVGYSLLFLGVLGIGNVLTVVVHELGHAAVARLVGLRVLKITIGSGPLMTSRMLGAIKLEARRFPVTGGATAIYDPTARPAKWRMGLGVVGGAGANFAFVVLGIFPFTQLPAGYHPAHPTLIVIPYAILASQLLAVITNLFPRRATLGQVKHASDGMLLIGIIASKNYRRRALAQRLFWEGIPLLDRRRYTEAWQHYSDAWHSLPESIPLLAMLIESAERASGPRAALQCYLDHGQGLRPTDGEERAATATVFVNAAWNAVLAGDRDQLALADQLSQQAVEMVPGLGAFQAIRGAVLVACQQQEQGRQMLIEGMRKIEQREHKAQFAQFLAERTQGATACAGEWQRLAAFLARGCDGR